MPHKPDLGTLPISKLTHKDIDNYQATIFCIALRLDHYDKGNTPDILHVTDFSRNSRLRNFQKPITISEYNIDDDQTLNVSAFRNKLTPVLVEYDQMSRNRFNQIRYDENARGCKKMLLNNLVILKLNVDFRLYNNQLQGRCNTIAIVDKNNDDCERLREFYARMVQHLPREFFDDLGNLPSKLIPAEFLNQLKRQTEMPVVRDTQHYRAEAINNTIDTQNYRTVQSPASSQRAPINDFSQPVDSGESSQEFYSQATALHKPSQVSTSYSSSNSSNNRDTLAAQVKRETNNTVITDLEFPEDYVPDEVHSPTPRQPVQSDLRTNSIFGKLNRDGKNIGENVVIRTPAYVVGSIPVDWTHICTKSYRSDLKLTDPKYQRLELILSDIPPNRHQEVSLTAENSLVITFAEEDLSSFFHNAPIEKIYISLAKLGTAFWKNRGERFNFEIHKKLIEINEDDATASVWTARNFGVSDLIKGLDEMF
ncbi:uncharacterized protein CANTADRAFT_4295 [Suhomyces tanzawaensis NRRL Y-17324]|uniref:Uncharacterized protein n=1 Tax=Suhomyces tanzawaensis NRRL Y-17324 TaxID=984487 RepID=A0A1E4SS84_9ASCO|nr:uncharacterized protein CANTADRAFT_4295 [Suhomyces tanzawaensis NRRL Y-17324]ODV82277.1 hypothetical protein CANTADRAFT_4295 [Suhomyces tanzawaensis NRRL Y-17324]